MGILTGTKPRSEVLKGDLEDAIFAADFGDLIAGSQAVPKVADLPRGRRTCHGRPCFVVQC